MFNSLKDGFAPPEDELNGNGEENVENNDNQGNDEEF